MFSPQRIEEIIKNANDIIQKADNGLPVPDATYIARHQLRDLSVAAMYLYQEAQAKQ